MRQDVSVKSEKYACCVPNIRIVRGDQTYSNGATGDYWERQRAMAD